MRAIERYIPSEIHVQSRENRTPYLAPKVNFSNVSILIVTLILEKWQRVDRNWQEREISFTNRLTGLRVIVVSRYYVYPLSRGCWLRWRQYSLSSKILYPAQESSISSRSSLGARDANACKNKDRASTSFLIISLQLNLRRIWCWTRVSARRVGVETTMTSEETRSHSIVVYVLSI